MTKSATIFVTNDDISEGRKYDVYLTMKQTYIDIAKSDYKYLCYTINGNSDSTGQCAITFEYASELLKKIRKKI